jgi:hypothetical protein
MFGLLIVVTVVGLYLIGNRLHMILTLLAFQMPEETKLAMAKEKAKAKLKNYGDTQWREETIKGIENGDIKLEKDSVTAMTQSHALLIYLILGLSAWIAVELGMLLQIFG